MDKIYSRKRIKFKWSDKKRKKIKLMFNVAVIVVITITVFIILINSIKPMFRSICINKAYEIATMVSNQEATAVMSNYQYEDIMKIYRDSEENIKMITANMITVNEIISDVAIKIQEKFTNISEDEIKISLGAFSKNQFLFGRGPEIPIKVEMLGKIETSFKTEFIEAGINQTIHRVYLEVVCNMNIVTPFDNVEEKIINQVLIMENLIVGEIPATYYDINGLDEQDYIEFVE